MHHFCFLIEMRVDAQYKRKYNFLNTFCCFLSFWNVYNFLICLKYWNQIGKCHVSVGTKSMPKWYHEHDHIPERSHNSFFQNNLKLTESHTAWSTKFRLISINQLTWLSHNLMFHFVFWLQQFLSLKCYKQYTNRGITIMTHTNILCRLQWIKKREQKKIIKWVQTNVQVWMWTVSAIGIHNYDHSHYKYLFYCIAYWHWICGPNKIRQNSCIRIYLCVVNSVHWSPS